MKGAIDLTKLLKMGDEVWSTACGSLVKICYIPKENDYIAYWDDEFMCSICVDIYGYTLPHVLGAIPDLVPTKDNWDWSNFKRDLPMNTFCVVSNDKLNWKLRHYAGKGMAYNINAIVQNSNSATAWKYIIPIPKFDFKTKKFSESDNFGTK